MTLWSINAEIEFDDGKRGALLTDGWHVRLKAQDGKTCYFPSCQPLNNIAPYCIGLVTVGHASTAIFPSGSRSRVGA
jgi:hypothetical protein